MSHAETIKGIAEKTGLKVEVLDDKTVRAIFRETEGRTQLVLMSYVGDLGPFPIVDIVSPVTDLPPGPMPADLANKLLAMNDNLKIGTFAIRESPEQRLLLFRHSMILNRLEPDEMRLVVETVTRSADQFEKDFTGGNDKY